MKDDILLSMANCDTALKCAEFLGIPYTTFVRKAIQFGVYSPNQGRANIQRYNREAKALSVFVKNSAHPTGTAKGLALELGLKTYCCEICGLSEWLSKRLVIELHHIDGDSRNHELSNLQMLCPNCHSQTLNWKSRNTKHESSSLS